MKRIQINRQHKDPPNTRRCVRPGKWGNDFKVNELPPDVYYKSMRFGMKGSSMVEFYQNYWDYERFYVHKWVIPSVSEAIRLYKTYQLPTYTDDDLRELLQYIYLGCWCKIGSPCHVSALIEEMERRGILKWFYFDDLAPDYGERIVVRDIDDSMHMIDEYNEIICEHSFMWRKTA